MIDSIRWLAQIVAFTLCVGSGTADAVTLRIASAFDPQTMDPHALALLYHTRVSVQVYESLLNRDEQFRLEPSLADAARRLFPHM